MSDVKPANGTGSEGGQPHPGAAGGRAADLPSQQRSDANEQLQREIAEREQAEEELRRFKFISDHANDAHFFLDADARILYVNDVACEWLGYTADELLRLRIPDIDPSYDLDHYRDAFARTQRGRVPPFETRHKRKDGSMFPVEISSTGVSFEGTPYVFAVVRDVTERHQMQARLVQSEKLASLGLLSAGIAHEINNPLAYVANNLAVLQRDLRGLIDLIAAVGAILPELESVRPDLARDLVQQAERIDLPYLREHLSQILSSTRDGVRRVSAIVQNLRGFARLDQASVDRIDLHDAIASSLELVRGQLRQRNIAVAEHYGDLPPVACAPAQINQVILNLLVNAMQAIEQASRDEGRIAIATRATDEEALIEIRDNGCGIPAEILPRIFDPFFTTKPVGQGTGLGLSISHGIIQDHGGHIEVQSTPGQGSCFRVILPINGPIKDQRREPKRS